LTCVSSGCEHDLNAFEMVNFFMLLFFMFKYLIRILQVVSLNDLFRFIENEKIACTKKNLVFVMCNLKLNNNQLKKQANDRGVVLDDLSFDNDFII